jgi:hypothetical protein
VTPTSTAILILVALVAGALVLWRTGLGAFIAEVLRDAMRRSIPADIASPKTLTGTAYSLSYPGNWRVETEDEDFDVDAYVCIDAPGGGNVVVQVVYDEDSVRKQVQATADRIAAQLRLTEKHELRAWGEHEGHGFEMPSTFFRNAGRIRVFGFAPRPPRKAGGPSVLVIIETRFDADEEKHGPGYELIERTFRLK